MGVGSAGNNICYHVTAFVIPFYLINMQHDHVLKKLYYGILTPPPGSSGGMPAKYLLTCCCTCELIEFDMQHDYVLVKLNFDLLTPPSRVGGGGGGFCRQNICYHDAAFVISFHLICNMTLFLKSWIQAF